MGTGRSERDDEIKTRSSAAFNRKAMETIMAQKKKREPWNTRNNKDLRIPDATPEQVAGASMRGGAKPRPETRRPSGMER